MRNPFKGQKALSAAPGVLEAVSNGRWQPYVALGGTNLNTRAISGAYVEAQSSTYGALYQYQPAVRSCVDYVARNISQLALNVYRRVSDGERQLENDHPAAVSLQNPNAWTPGQKLIFNLVADFMVYDNAYLWKFGAPNTDRVVLVNVPPPAVGIIGEERFTAEGYRFYRSDGTYFDVAPSDVIHWRGYDPENPRAGFSKLETLRQELAADAAARQAKTELDKAGLLPRGWIERPVEAGELNQEQLDRLREQASNWGKQSTRKIPILEEGMVFKQATVSPEDAQLLESRQFTKIEVNAAYGLQNVPPQSEDERRGVYADVLPPYCEGLCSFLDLFLLKGEYQDDELYTQFNLDEKLRGEPVARWAAMTSSAGAPWRTRNEVRALEGLPPIDGGDDLIVPLNVTEESENPLPAPGIMPVQDPNKPPQDGSYRQDEGPTPIPSGNRGRRSLNGSQTARKQLHVSTQPRRVGDRARQRRAIDQATGTLLRFYNRQASNLTRKGIKAADTDRWNRELADDLKRVIRRIFELEGGIYVSRLGGEDFDISQRGHYITAMAEGIADAVNLSTQQDIQQFGLEEAFARARNERAPTLGTNIGSSATREARYEAAAQSPGGANRTKTWVANTSRHAEFDGETVGISESFSGGFEPGSAPHCACSADIN